MFKLVFRDTFGRRVASTAALATAIICAWPVSAEANICSTNGCTIPLYGHIYLDNNWWGVSESGASGSQNVWTNPSESSSAGGSTVNWNAGNNQYQVKSYSGMYDGWEYTNGFQGSPFPYKISSNHAVNNEIDGYWSTNGSYDSIWDSFYSYSSNPSPSGFSPNMEIEVYIDASFYPSNPVAQMTTSNGWTWNVYKGGDAWPVWLFVPETYPNGENYNLMNMANWLYTSGRCSGSLYMLNDNFGEEVYYTNGSSSFGWNHISAP
jgi:hypothetical protein